MITKVNPSCLKSKQEYTNLPSSVTKKALNNNDKYIYFLIETYNKFTASCTVLRMVHIAKNQTTMLVFSI